MMTNSAGMQRFLLAVMAMAAGLVLLGCTQTEKGTSGNEGNSTVTGFVRYENESDHAGIMMTLESLAAQGQIVSRTSTSSSGQFTMTGIAQGSYNLYAASEQSLEKAVVQTFSIGDGVTLTTDEILLTPVGHIHGVAQMASPVINHTGINVYIPGSSYSAFTSGEGEYTISNVPVGTYQVSAFISGYLANSVSDVQVTRGAIVQAGAIELSNQDLPPQIRGITASPFFIRPGATSTLSASADDPNNDPITYDWSVGTTSGSVVPDGQNPEIAVYTAPNSEGVFTISLSVTANSLTDATQILLQVSANAPIPSEFKLVASGTTGDLYELNETTGIAQKVSLVKFAQLTQFDQITIGGESVRILSGLEFDHANEILYAVTGRSADGNDPCINCLLAIDAQTGVAVRHPAPTFSPLEFFVDLAFDHQGELYAILGSGNTRTFEVVETADGTTTRIGVIPLAESGAGNGLVFDSADLPYYTNAQKLVRLGKAIGDVEVSTALTFVGFEGEHELSSAAPIIRSMTRHPITGEIFGILSRNEPLNASHYLVKIDLETATATNLGQTRAGLMALTFMPADLVPAPLAEEPGNVTGRIVNSSTGAPLIDVVVSVRNTAFSTTTDVDGNFTLSDVPAGPQIIQFALPGYTISNQATVVISLATVPLGTINATPDGALDPTATNIRVVLTWDSGDPLSPDPPDMDILAYVPGQCFEGTPIATYYGNRDPNRDGTGTVLDVDDLDGFGPETITILNPVTGRYRFLVDAYSFSIGDSPVTLSDSKPRLELYTVNGLLQRIDVPASSTVESTWIAFDLVFAADGSFRINPVNIFWDYLNPTVENPDVDGDFYPDPPQDIIDSCTSTASTYYIDTFPTDGSTSLDTYIVVYDAEGNYITEADDTSGFFAGTALDLNPGETVTIQVTGFSFEEVGPYSIRVSQTPYAGAASTDPATADANTREPGDNLITGATVLTLDTDVDGFLDTGANHEDWFIFTAPVP